MRGNISIIGAGTAGLIAARELGRSGIYAKVYDQKKVLGYPVRASGIVSIRGLASIGVDYGKAVTNTLYGARIHAGKSVMRVKSSAPVAHVLERQMLNELCREQAAEAGADISLNERITPERISEIKGEDGIMIGADGAVSTVAKHFRMGPLADHVITYKAEFEMDVKDTTSVDLFFDREYRGLFGWLCPNSDDRLEAGIGIMPGRMNAKQAFDRFVRNDDIAGMVDGARMTNGQASIIPMRLRRRIVDEKNKVLLVGDAAGQVKPTTGGGIVFGGNGAIIAARAIQGHLERGRSLMEYDASYKKRFSADTRMHSMINKLYTRSGTKGMDFGIRIMNAIGMASLLGRYGDMDSPTKTMMNVFSGKQRVTE